MSFVIQGPYPAMKTTLLLPSPLEGNNKGNSATVQTIRAMDGKVYTYIKSKRARDSIGISWPQKTKPWKPKSSSKSTPTGPYDWKTTVALFGSDI